MKSALCFPLEVWMDILVFPWINNDEKRQKLVQFSNCFGDREFAEVLDFFLHKFVKQTMSPLRIEMRNQNWILWFIICLAEKMAVLTKLRKKKNHYNSCVYLCDGITPVKFAKTPLPENVKQFKRIEIHHFDGQALEFLHKLKPILHNVQLSIEFTMTFSTRHTLAETYQNILFILSHLFPLLQENTLICLNKLTLNIILAWLETAKTPMESTEKPRLFILELQDDFDKSFVPCIKKKFRSAQTPCNFNILLLLNTMITFEIENFELENGKTGETLIGQHLKNLSLENKTFLITRQQSGAEPTTMLEWIEQNVNKCLSLNTAGLKQCICVENPTVGHLGMDDKDKRILR